MGSRGVVPLLDFYFFCQHFQRSFFRLLSLIPKLCSICAMHTPPGSGSSTNMGMSSTCKKKKRKVYKMTLSLASLCVRRVEESNLINLSKESKNGAFFFLEAFAPPQNPPYLHPY